MDPRFRQLAAAPPASPSLLGFWGWLLVLGGVGVALWYGQKKGRQKVGRWRAGHYYRKAARHRQISTAALLEAEAIGLSAGLDKKALAKLVKAAGTPQEAVAIIENTIEAAAKEQDVLRTAFVSAVKSACKVTGEPRVPGGKTGGRPKRAWNAQYNLFRGVAEEKFGVKLPKPGDTAFGELTKELGV